MSDSIQILDDAKLPIMSFGFYGVYGSPGSGKTYITNKICDAYVEQAHLHKYDLEKPYDLEGPIDFIYFISPSIMSDQTLRKNKGDKILIEGTKQNVLALCDYIFKMRDDVYACIEMQQNLRSIFQQKGLQKVVEVIHKENLLFSQLPNTNLDREWLQILRQLQQCIKFIETSKAKYPMLQVKETNQEISSHTSMFAKCCGLAFNGCWLKRPKIIMLLDDMSGTSLFQNISENNFYRMMTQRRHLSIYCCVMAIHGMSVTWGYFRAIQTAFLMFAGCKEEQVKSNFADISRLQSANFNEKNFLELYHQVIGFQEDDFDKRKKYEHNFMYVIIQPVPQIWYNFDQRMK